MPVQQQRSSRGTAAGAATVYGVGGRGRAGAGNAAMVARIAALASGADDRSVEQVGAAGGADLDAAAFAAELVEDGGKALPNAQEAAQPVPAPAPEASGMELGSGATERTRAVYAANVARERDATLHTTLTPDQAQDLALFVRNWEANRARYESVSVKTGVPAALVAALHWRESTGDFRTYLHQGDPLGKPAVNVPSDIPVFHVWEDAAVHALTMPDKASKREQLGIDASTRDGARLGTFAEVYNGLGYHYKDMASPYVWSGTSAYGKGKYVSDGRFSANTKDRQNGVRVMLDSIGGVDPGLQRSAPQGASGWASLLEGRTLAPGARGPLVEELQRRLVAAGQRVSVDGDFGPGTKAAVLAVQKASGLDADGVVGTGTARVIDGRARPAQPEGGVR
jgi:lysozyme family protein